MYSAYCKAYKHLELVFRRPFEMMCALQSGSDSRVIATLLCPRHALLPHVFYSAGHGTRFRLSHYPNKPDPNFVGASKKAA